MGIEVEKDYASRGQANLNTVLGSLGTASFAMPLVSAFLGNCNGWNMGGCNNGCSENMIVNRYELGQNQKISELQSAIALRDANTYGDQKLLEVYRYMDGQLRDIRDTLCAQAVTNQKTADSFALASADLAAVKQDLCNRIALEADGRAHV